MVQVFLMQLGWEIMADEKEKNITTLNDAQALALSANLDNLQYLRSIDEHLWWLAEMVKITLFFMLISIIGMILMFMTANWQ